MELFLSGAKSADAAQTSAEASLGGYKSSTKMPNGRIDFLFDAISEFTKFEGRIEHKAIFLKNTTNAAVANIEIHYIYDDNRICDFLVAAVSTIANNKIEKIASTLDYPFDAEFVDASAAYAKTLVTISTAPTAGDSISIMEDIEVIATSSSIIELIDALVLESNDSATYKVIKIADNKFEIQRRTVGVFTSAFAFGTDGTVNMSAPNFAGGIDNTVLITETLAAGACLGLWIQRKTPKSQQKTEAQMIEELESGEILKQENVQFIISYT